MSPLINSYWGFLYKWKICRSIMKQKLMETTNWKVVNDLGVCYTCFNEFKLMNKKYI
jgi:hypothetical protein